MTQRPDTHGLFSETDTQGTWQEPLGAGAVVLHGYAIASEHALLSALDMVIAAAPFRHMVTPGGFEMSVAMTNCGQLGWTSNRNGYRYAGSDPLMGLDWPAMPAIFRELAASAAATAGFDGFVPDACLINYYAPGAKLSLHQDKDEHDFSQPIVSVSLGASAIFLFGGLKRSDNPCRVPLVHGDVVVWGGPDRLRYHGVLALKKNSHPLFNGGRINLTLRKAA